MTRFSTLSILLAIALSACVPKAPRRANAAEARAGYPQPGAEQASVENLLEPPSTRDERPELEPGQVYSAGYWHWDGVRYVRVGGTIEDTAPAYLWSHH